MSASWGNQAQELSELLQSSGSNGAKILQLLKILNTPLYPIENLRSENVESLVQSLVKYYAVCGVSDGEFRIQVAHLMYNLLTYQKAAIHSDVLTRLLHLFLSSLAITHPPNELLYGSAAILNIGISHKDPLSLLDESAPLFKLALTSLHPVETQRAGLHFLLALCEKAEISRPVLLSMLDALLQSIGSSQTCTDPLLLNKLLLSKLRLLHSIVPHLSPLPSGSLPNLLSVLKASMATGLPGQGKASSSNTVGSIHPPLAIPPSLTSHASPKSKPMYSVAGPQERRAQGKGKNRGKTKATKGDSAAKVCSDDSGVQSSDSESSSSSTSEASLLQLSAQPAQQHQSADSRRGGKSWRQGYVRTKGASSSESEVSDSDTGLKKLRTVSSKIRHEALSCLAIMFQLLDRHAAFSYWLSFLPDGPRPPNSPPLLLTCVLKDPIPKCRGTAVSVLCAMLEGSKSYLAVADDKPLPAHAFTPYSVTIGGVVRELHRSLLLALTAEPHPTTLTQIIKALGLVVANSPYHQLSEGYISRVTASLGRLSYHRDVTVQVACLTCYGAVISLSPSHVEVVRWLQSNDDPAGTPWLLQHCISLLQTQSTLALQTESLQILAALAKFYFPQISNCWLQLKDIYFSHLASLPHRVQQHVLKMLEELCRALSSSPSADVAIFWEQLLGGPLTLVLQNYSEHGVLSSRACDILATMTSQMMAMIKAPFRMLALTLPLGLSKDDSTPSAVNASAVRVLGVFILFDHLVEDDNFFLDCLSAITHCLGSTSMAVRVQASWALANLMDSFSAHHHTMHLTLLLSLCESVHCTLQDGDKVKCNGVRAAGNLLRQLPEQAASTCEAVIDKFTLQLAKCVSSGSMKSRWNACYACHSAFCNTVFTSKFPSNVSQLLSALCGAVQNCKNFKVRSNAAMALSNAALSRAIGGPQLDEVWVALFQALENSEQQVDFSEFKHAATLKQQPNVWVDQKRQRLEEYVNRASNRGEHTANISLKDGITSLHSGGLADSFSYRHMSRFLSKASSHVCDEDAVDKEREETRALVDRARQNLERIVSDREEDAGLKSLLEIFRKFFLEENKG